MAAVALQPATEQLLAVPELCRALVIGDIRVPRGAAVAGALGLPQDRGRDDIVGTYLEEMLA